MGTPITGPSITATGAKLQELHSLIAAVGAPATGVVNWGEKVLELIQAGEADEPQIAAAVTLLVGLLKQL